MTDKVKLTPARVLLGTLALLLPWPTLAEGEPGPSEVKLSGAQPAGPTTERAKQLPEHVGMLMRHLAASEAAPGSSRGGAIVVSQDGAAGTVAGQPPNAESGPAPAQTGAQSAPGRAEPFAFADFTWLNGNPRTHDSPLDTKVFTGEFRVDTLMSAANGAPGSVLPVGEPVSPIRPGRKPRRSFVAFRAPRPHPGLANPTSPASFPEPRAFATIQPWPVSWLP
jgi:hypothetical protein